MRNTQALRKETVAEANTWAEGRRLLRAARASDAHVPSPAAAIQHQLDLQLRARADADEPARWSPRSTLIFSASISLVLWAAAIAAAAYLAPR